MNACDTVLFDFGHTLVDLRASDLAMRRVYARIRHHLRALGHRDLPAVEVLVARVASKIDRIIDDSYRGTSLEELRITRVFDEAYREIGLALGEDDLMDIVLMEHQALSTAMIPAEGVSDTLVALKSMGLKLGVVSNMTNLPEMMRRDLARFGLLEHFDVTVFSSETGIRKPHPQIYRAALDGVGSTPSSAVFVGDRIREDVLGPQSLGMRAVLSHQFRREELNGASPEKVILDLKEILEYVESMSST